MLQCKYISITVLIGRIALVVQWPIVVKLSCGWSVGPNVCASVGRSVCPVHCGKTVDRIQMLFGIIGRTGPGMRQVAGFGYPFTGRGTFGANLGRATVTNGDITAYISDSAATWHSSHITLGRHVIISATLTNATTASYCQTVSSQRTKNVRKLQCREFRSNVQCKTNVGLQ